MSINPEVRIILHGAGIAEDEAILYLLAVHFGLKVGSISKPIVKKVNLTGIFNRSFIGNTNLIKWKIPLFANIPVQQNIQVDDVWEWVNTEFRSLFKAVNPDRNGEKQTCITRMKWFFSQYPQYRKLHVITATKAYLATVNDARYCKKAHKFICEGTGQFRESMLLEWCDRLKTHMDDSNASTFKKM